MFISRTYQIKVDFIRNHQNMIVHTDTANTFQLFSAPYTSAWVVGTAENQEFGVWILCFCFKIIKVDFVGITGAD